MPFKKLGLFSLLSHRKIRKKIIIISLIFFGLFVGLLVSNSIFNISRIDMLSLENSAERVLKKIKIISKKAQSFDEKKVLKMLGENSANGFYYRFDDHLEEAICEDKEFVEGKIRKDAGNYCFEFNCNETIKFKPKRGKFICKGGVLKLWDIRNDYLQSTEDLNIVRDNMAEIELRIKLKKGRRIELIWSKDNFPEMDKPIIIIETIPDNTFHIYKINMKNVLHCRLKHRNIIKKLFISFPNVHGDEVEIDYIRFVSKREKYNKKFYANVYETINKEMRKMIYTHTPLTLKYSVDIPKEEHLFLKFGMGILEKNDPVEFKIVVECEGTQKEEFFKEIITPDEWHDAKIDFTKWQGKTVEVLFKTESTKGNIAFWSNPIIYTPPEEKFNVVIVLEDSLRADYTSLYGYSKKTTPVKDNFNGVLFLNAFSQATCTRPSCPTIMTSLYPSATGVSKKTDMLHDNYLTLAEIMRNQGFATASFTQNGNAGPNSGLHQGFSNLFDEDAVGFHRTDELYSEELYEWIKANNDRNFFLYLHLINPHRPYNPPYPFDAWYKKSPLGKILVEKDKNYDPEWIKTPTLEGRRLLYDGEILENDFYFKKFFQKIKKYGLLNDTLLVFIGDHGEHLGEYGLWGHKPPGYIQVLHVPLFMVYPNKLPKNVKLSQPVQIIDLMPTILDLANIDKDNFLIAGDSLISLINGEKLSFWNKRLSISEELRNRTKNNKSNCASIFYKNYHIINSNRLEDAPSKLLNLCFNNVGVRTFNLKDKEEKHYLNTYFIDIFFKYKIKSFLEKFVENNKAIWKTLTKNSPKSIKYDPAVLERLKSLGYLQ